MIATDRFLFIHLHKTGGQFVNRLLTAYLPTARRLGYHLPRSQTPPTLLHLPALGFVRNPWDWYVSWYAFNAAHPTRNPIFRVVSEHGRHDFKTTIVNMLSLGSHSHRTMRDRIIAALPAERNNTSLGSGITQAILMRFDRADWGYFTWLWHYMFFVNDTTSGARIGHMETLRTDLLAMLKALNVFVPSAMQRAVMMAPPVNLSRRSRYREYYDAELARIVAEKDREIIERYGYKFYSFGN
jgi:hypothetical protein